MNSRKYVTILICLCLSCSLCATSAPLSAQEKSPDPDAPAEPLAAEREARKPVVAAGEKDQEASNTRKVDSVKTELERIRNLEGKEDLKKKVIPLLEATIANLETAKDWQKKAETYDFTDEDREATEEETTSFQQKIDKGFPVAEEALKPFRVTSNPELEEIKDKLDKLNAQLVSINQDKAKAKKERDDLQVELERRKTRAEEEIPARRDAIEKRLKEIDQLLQEPAPEGEDPDLTNAKRDALTSEQQMLREEENALELEKPFYEARKNNRKTKLNLLNKQLEYWDELQPKFNDLKAELEQKILDKTTSEAQKTVAQASPPLKPLARSVAEIMTFLSGTEGPNAKKEAFKNRLEDITQELQTLRDEEAATKTTLSNDLRPQTLAQMLDRQRNLLSQHPSVYHFEEAEVSHRSQWKKYFSEQLDKREEYQNELSEILREPAISAILKADRDDPLRKEAEELLGKHEESMSRLNEEYDKLLNVLNGLSDAEGEMVSFLRTYNEYLDQKSLWVPVAEVLQWRDFKNMTEGFAPLVEPANWRLLTETLAREIWNSPVWSGVIIVLALAFFPVQSRLKRRLFQLSDEFSANFLAPFDLTKKAFFITLLLPLWLPVICWIVGYRLLRVLPATSDPAANPAFVPAFGRALVVVAFVLCVLRLLRYLVKPNGLGEVHFRWPKQQLAKVRLHLHLFTVCVVPLAFLITMIYRAGSSEERRSLGRILMVALLLLTSWFLYRVLAPAKSKDERTSSVKLSLWKKLSIYGPCCVPLCFALLSISGYTYTAAVLMRRLILSSGILLLLVMLNELAYRWVYIARGKLALEHARQRQEAREAEEAAKAEGESAPLPRVFDPRSSGVDLSSINTQTRKLLTTSFGLAVFVSMWWVWSDVTPQVAFLNKPVFETSALTQMAEESPAGAEGTPAAGGGTTGAPAKAAPSTGSNAVTYGSLLLFVLTIVLTLIASRNLPGLLEISVLQRLPLDTGIRYAAGTIARYILLAIGIVVSCQFLHIGMTQISILLGGLAVGLGFGLQEMFANFVSGIILLFEQPLRVGDIVSIGDVTGSVTRIRIRATTITDWDRKEFIIPNKEFIVGQFNNWTLTDTVNRVVILVGVAYGADTERARNLLLKVCADHPEVLDDPAPSAIFDAFGDSALNLTLRCYLPKLDNRLQTIHELHTAIDREFKKAGLEIAFPQMDLHLRSIDQIKNPIPLAQELPESQQV